MPDADNCLVGRARGFVIKVLHAAGQTGQQKTGLFPFRYGPLIYLVQLERGEPVGLVIVGTGDLGQLQRSLSAARDGNDYQSQDINYKNA